MVSRSIEDSCYGDGYLKAPGWNLVPAVERGMGINKQSKGRFWRVAHILEIDEERELFRLMVILRRIKRFRVFQRLEDRVNLLFFSL